jgi:hypothetical protein
MDLILYRALAKDRDQRFQTMSEFEEALSDPKGYASVAPVIGIPEDLSGVARAASPMARAEMDARSKLFSSGSGLELDRPPGGIPSTFREGRGELFDRWIPKKKSGVLFFYGGGLALAGALLITFGPFHGGNNKQSLPTTPTALHPSAVRINFNSDPDGAIVLRSDGKTLGLTPLSIEVPYSDSAVEFQFRKVGFEKKTVYVVPNLPSPLFATLHKVEAPPPEAASEKSASPVRRNPFPANPPAQIPKKKAPPAEKPAQHNDDEDGTLEPSFSRP